MRTSYFDQLRQEDHEAVILCSDAASGLRAVIAIHDTTLGPAAGGTRRWNYSDEGAALEDALRLSRGMTLKSAASGLHFGGGKIVMMAEAGEPPKPEQYRMLGRHIERLAGNFITGEDVGTGDEELRQIGRSTRWVVGLPRPDLAKPETSAQTALGVLVGLKTCLESVFGREDPAGRTIAIQGLGHVGMKLARQLFREGARLIVTDVDATKMAELTRDERIRTVGPDSIYENECDVFAPCALGGTLNSRTIPRLKCSIVAGCANNQLEKELDGEALRDRDILYAPDFVINAGGAIDNLAMVAPDGYDERRVREDILRIRERMIGILSRAACDGISTEAAAIALAQERLQKAREERIS